VQTDVADEASVARMVANAVKVFSHIDVLVNNAAIFVLRGIEATPEEWRQVLDVNVMGPALVAKHVVPHMRQAGGGAIVNLASISSFIAQPHFVTYNATKAAIANMTRCMALDLAADNIRVNAVCPGAVWTQIVQRITREAGMDRAAADAHPDWGGAHMIRRIAEPREIAYAILFLASDEASFITAENLMVDGGYTAK
jgi:dihydroanticapsin dehydrogenase